MPRAFVYVCFHARIYVSGAWLDHCPVRMRDDSLPAIESSWGFRGCKVTGSPGNKRLSVEINYPEIYTQGEFFIKLFPIDRLIFVTIYGRVLTQCDLNFRCRFGWWDRASFAMFSVKLSNATRVMITSGLPRVHGTPHSVLWTRNI